MEFIETRAFKQYVDTYATTEWLHALQQELLEWPERGSVIRGSGGLRKLRAPDPRRGKGKRGGIRIIYHHAAHRDTILLLFAYDKDTQGDLTPEQTRALAQVYRKEFG